MRELCARRDRGCTRQPTFKLQHNCATAVPQCELGLGRARLAIRKQLPADRPETGFGKINGDVLGADFWIAWLRVHIQELLLFSLISLDPNNSQSGCECASSAAEELCAPGSEYVAQGELHEARRG